MSNGLFFKAYLPSLVSTSECCPVIKLPRESIKILVTILHDNILKGDLFSVDIAYNLWIYTQQNVNILNRVSNIIRFAFEEICKKYVFNVKQNVSCSLIQAYA